MEFLTASNKKGLGDKVNLFDSGVLNAEGKNVVVIGGGDTAMDCVRTSIRQNANSVKCLYRRDKENMPGSAREVVNAEEEGVEFVWLSSPKEFIGTNKVETVKASKMKLGEPDESGRRKPIEEKGTDFIIKADLVIKALGFDPENLPELFGESNLQVSRWGTIKADFDTMETSIPGVFAAGDIIRGASLVVWAIKDGRDASDNIDKYLKNKIQQNKSCMKNLREKNLKKLKENHIYHENMEHDACGVGLVVSTEGKKSRKVVEAGIEALKAVWHRGAIDADGKTGDGAGIHIEIPTDFFVEKIEVTGHSHDNSELCVGMIFLPRNDYSAQEECRTIVESELTKNNFNIYGWRQVPVNPSVLGEKAEQTRPEITQIFFKHNNTKLKVKNLIDHYMRPEELIEKKASKYSVKRFLHMFI